jgi:hypothetical protein
MPTPKDPALYERVKKEADDKYSNPKRGLVKMINEI